MHRSPYPILLLWPFLLLSSATWLEADEPVPQGPSFQVNSYTTSYQQTPSVAVAPSGGGASGQFLVLWDSEGSTGSDTSSFGIQAQQLDASDVPMGSEYAVNTYTTLGQNLAHVALAANGEGVAVWASIGSAGTDTFGGSIQARRVGSDGQPLASDFQVNTDTEWHQTSPSVAMRPSGEFVVVWETGADSMDDEFGGIRGQLFDADGQKLGGEFQVNSHTTLYQTSPRVAMAHSGSFVVVWQSNSSPGNDNSGTSVVGRSFDADGQPQGGDFQVNTITTQSQDAPDVSASPIGDFVVTWSSSVSAGDDSSGRSIQARRFDASAIPLTPEMQVNETTSDAQRTPSVAMARSRDFLVVWSSDSSPGDDTSGAIVGRWFEDEGTPRGADFQVNTYTTQLQTSPAVAVAPNGDFVVAWTSEGSPGDDDDLFSIQARRFAGRIQGDDFDDGTLGLWTVNAP